MFAFSSLFSATVAAAAFDVAIERDAANGRVNAEFIGALGAHYGLDVPVSPKGAILFANEFLTLDKAPRLASGPGARAAAPAVARALLALGEALHAAGKVKALPILAKLPAWADEAILAEKGKAATEKRKATAAAKAAAPAATVAVSVAPAPAATPATATAPDVDLNSHVNAILAAAKGGHLTAQQIGALRAALDIAVAVADSVPTASKGGKVSAPAATLAAENALM